jgi:hypothetical protein
MTVRKISGAAVWRIEAAVFAFLTIFVVLQIGR